MKNPLLRYRNIIRADERRRNIQKYKATISGVAKRILREEYGGHAPKHGWRPPGVTVLDDDALPSGTPDGKHYRTMNMRTGLIATDDDDRVDIDADTGFGAGPYAYDYLIDTNWATVVAAGTIIQGSAAAEGAQLTTFHGWTFKVYSTLQGAITDANSDNTSGYTYNIGVVPGTYAEQISWPSTTAGQSYSGLNIVGLVQGDEHQDYQQFYWNTGSLAAHSPILLDSTNPLSMQLENIVFNAQDGYETIRWTAGVNLTGHAINCEFRDPVEMETNVFIFLHCKFTGNGLFRGQNTDDLFFNQCVFAGGSPGIDLSTDEASATGVSAVGCDFIGLAPAIQIVEGNGLTITGNHFSGSAATNNDIIIQSSGTSSLIHDVEISGNFFEHPTTTTNATILIATAAFSSAEIYGVIISDNVFSGQQGAVAATTAIVKMTGNATSKIHSCLVWGNAFPRDDTIADTMEDNGGYSVIGDYVEDSVFGPNTPLSKAQYNITNGANNIFMPETADLNGNPDSGLIPIVDETLLDHGNLTGLSDDDHTQYFLADGSRELAGDLVFDSSNRSIEFQGTFLQIAAGATGVWRITSSTLTFLNSIGLDGGDGTIDFSANASLALPVSATPTVNADGEIAFDTTVTNWSTGLLRFYGNEEQVIPTIPVANIDTTDGYVLAYNATNDEWEMVAQSGSGVTDHGALTGLTDDDHTQYALLLGRSGGQTLIGGTGASDALTLQATSHATPGQIILDDDTILSNGYGMVIGHTSQITAPNLVVDELQVLGTSAADSGLLIGRWQANANSPHLDFVKSRNATIGSSTVVQDDDTLYIIRAVPDDGTNFDTSAAEFSVEVDDASPTTGDVGTAYVWKNMPGGGGSLTERLRIPAEGGLLLPEQASATGLTAYGQDWVRNDSPSTRMFTDDTGVDWRLNHNGALPFFISGNGSAITTGIKGWIEVPIDCTIVACRLLLDQSDTIKIDIWKDTYANYPPTDADTITGGNEPATSAATKDEDTTLTSWTTSLSEGDILYFNVDTAPSSATACLVSLTVIPV